MSNLIGERYQCSDPDCGCEIEILRPCRMLDEALDSQSGSRTRLSSSELSTPPSEVAIPRERPGLEEGAGERPGAYGSPKFEAQSRGPFREEEGLRSESGDGKASSSAINAYGVLTCFCGNPMKLSSSRLSSAA